MNPKYRPIIPATKEHNYFTSVNESNIQVNVNQCKSLWNGGVTPAIGIDLGTRNSCVGVWYQDKVEIITNDLRDRTTPSFVAFTPAECLIGEGARNQVTKNSAYTIYDAIRLLGRRYDDPEVQEGIKSWPFKVIKGTYGFPKIVVEYKGKEKAYSGEEISSMVLVELKNLAESYLGTIVRDAVITVPAYFKDLHRQAMKVAAHLAGLDILEIIDEPVSAAIAYGLHTKTDESNVLVFDLDDDRFDVSLVNINEKGNLTVKATRSDHTHFSVQNMVNIMVDHFVKEFKKKHKVDLSMNLRALDRLRYHSDRAIQDLSSASEITIYIDGLHEGVDFCTIITMRKFEHIKRCFFSKCIDTVASCLIDAKINKTDVDDIVLVGNSTMIPKVQQLLQEFFIGKDLCLSIQPEEVVAYGATTYAEYLRIEKSKKPKNLSVVDIVPLSLGVDAHDGVFSIIIPRHTPIPAQKENIYFTTRDNEDSISFNVYQGERSRAKDNNWLGKIDVTVSLAPKGKSKVKVVFNIDANGTLTCWVKEFTTGLKRKIIIDNDKVKRSEEEIQDMVNDAERYKLEDQEYKKIMCTRNVLEEYIYNVKRKMKTIGSTDETRINAEEIKKMEKAMEEANQYLDKNPKLTDVDEYQMVTNQLEKVCVAVISQLA